MAEHPRTIGAEEMATTSTAVTTVPPLIQEVTTHLSNIFELEILS